MIEVSDIVKFYGSSKSKNQVLRGINLQIANGDFTVILGTSGSGKSTFLHVISGLERPDSGRVVYDTLDITKLSENELTKFRRDNIGFIFQQYYLLPNMTVEKNVRMGADLAGNTAYREMIKAVGLEDKMKKYPSELSAASNREYPLPVRLRKSPECCFWMSQQALWMSRQADRFLTISVNCIKNLVFLS